MRRAFYALGGAILAALLTASVAVVDVGIDLDEDGQSSQESSERELPVIEEGHAYMGWSLTEPARSMRARSAPPAMTAPLPTTGVQGIDVSIWQGNVNWPAMWLNGKRFAYVKATEGISYPNPFFAQQYDGSRAVGMIRGSYHFGRPDFSGGAEQADYFVKNGGHWAPDGTTLPGVLDIEYNPGTATDSCYGKTRQELVQWVKDFVTRYKLRTGREAVIYTNAHWWKECTGDSTAFATTNSLWVPYYRSVIGELPGQWPHHTFWQYSDTPVDQNQFNGTFAQLHYFAATPGRYLPKNPNCPAHGAPLALDAVSFCDVPHKHAFQREITWLADTGVTTGYVDGTFRPTNRITREAMAAFLYRYAGKAAFTAPKVSPFKDVTRNHAFYTEITWLAKQGITTGYEDGTFQPGKQITREAMAAFLYRYENPGDTLPTQKQFKDVPMGHAFGREIAWLARNEITTGYPDGTFRPGNKITREATAAFLHRLDRL